MSVALRALKALNRARLSASGSASDLQAAIDAADRASGYDRQWNRPQSAPHQRGERERSRPTCAVRDCLAGSRCSCGRCRRRAAARLAVLRAQAEIAAGDWDARVVLAAANSPGILVGSAGGAR